jgi:photosystem II stability/assembly factor-like uncharacterized protein
MTSATVGIVIGWIQKTRAAFAALVLVALAALGVSALLNPKRVHPAWEPLAVDGLAVTALALDANQHLYVGGNAMNEGRLLRSRDGGRTFERVDLRTSALWSLAWLSRAQQLCAGTRDGLMCVGSDGVARAAMTEVDTYFAVEVEGGVVTGGFPSVQLGAGDLQGFAPTLDVAYAAHSAVVTQGRLFVTGDSLRFSDDGARTFRAVSQVSGQTSAVAAEGPRVYVAGGTFGASFYRSDDRGDHWRALDVPAKQPEQLWVMPGRPDVVMLADHGDVRTGDLWLSLDGGASWNGLGCPGSEVHAVAVDDRYVYCGATSMSGRAGLWRRARASVLPAR